MPELLVIFGIPAMVAAMAVLFVAVIGLAGEPLIPEVER